MAEDKLQPQRFELKYLVSPKVALSIRDFVSSYLVLDEYSVGQPNNSYPNHSLYLDSDNLRFYWDVVKGNKNRYKLRIRYYSDAPGSPAFMEIKRRVDNAILKQRGPVHQAAIPLLLAGHLPEPEHLLSDQPKHLTAVQHFCHLMQETEAVPKSHVAYMREAWVSQSDNSIRVTLDREVRSAPHFSSQIRTKMEGCVMPFEPLVILELKFTTRLPNWFREMAEVFELAQCGVAKYAEGVAMLGERQLSPNGFPPPLSGCLIEKFLSRQRTRNPDAQAGISPLFSPYE